VHAAAPQVSTRNSRRGSSSAETFDECRTFLYSPLASRVFIVRDLGRKVPVRASKACRGLPRTQTDPDEKRLILRAAARRSDHDRRSVRAPSGQKEPTTGLAMSTKGSIRGSDRPRSASNPCRSGASPQLDSIVLGAQELCAAETRCATREELRDAARWTRRATLQMIVPCAQVLPADNCQRLLIYGAVT
jgi:hypothetical protein